MSDDEYASDAEVVAAPEPVMAPARAPPPPPSAKGSGSLTLALVAGGVALAAAGIGALVLAARPRKPARGQRTPTKQKRTVPKRVAGGSAPTTPAARWG